MNRLFNFLALILLPFGLVFGITFFILFLVYVATIKFTLAGLGYVALFSLAVGVLFIVLRRAPNNWAQIRCPECGQFFSFKHMTWKTTEEATETKGGLEEHFEMCQNCGYERSMKRRTARLLTEEEKEAQQRRAEAFQREKRRKKSNR